MVTAHTTAYRGLSIFTKKHDSCSPPAAETAISVSAAFSCRKPIEERVRRSANLRAWVSCRRNHRPRTNWHTSANCSRVQSIGNAACLAGSEEGRRTGQRMGYRGTCTYPHAGVQAQELRIADSNFWRHGDEPRARSAMPCSGETRLNTSS